MSEQDVVVVAEIEGDSISDMTLELLAAARAMTEGSGGDVLVALLSVDGAQHATGLGPADRILKVDSPLLSSFSPQPFLDALEAVIRQASPRAVLFASSTVGLDLAPALAAKLKAPCVGNCRGLAIDGASVKATCGFCAGKLLTDVEVEAAPAIVTVLPGAFHATEQTGRGDVEAVSVELEAGAIQFEEMIPADAGDIDITQQDVLVSVGRGIQQEDNMEVAEELAEALGGALCASRPIVDQGWLPTTRQVGKSGMIVKPRLYLALGISGAPEHVEGMAGAELTIAVNTDPEAPIFETADYGTEMDLLDLGPELTEALKRKKVAH
jgi:electron transfer flavoprotein alpha subunit